MLAENRAALDAATAAAASLITGPSVQGLSHAFEHRI